MRFLLIPENNSLSHLVKCLAVMDILKSVGHEAHVAISQKHSGFLNRLGIKHHILTDIQESDNGGFPSSEWFSNIETITQCINEEVALIKKVKPDRILGVFRFTLYASSKLTEVPYDSLICGCMIPDCHEALGFSENEAGSETQKQLMDNFFRFAGRKFSLAIQNWGLPKIEDIRMSLEGDRTFLWDFPEFLPLPKRANRFHIGPISFEGWPYDSVDLNPLLKSDYPLAVVSFGTCVTNSATVARITRLLLELGYKVLIAAGGQAEMAAIKLPDSSVYVVKFAPLHKIFPYTSLLVTHGGQMTVFEALQNKVPVLVIPLQPEQAHNGVCLERIGCGARLIPSTHFTGFPEDYIRAFNQINDEKITATIKELVMDSHTKNNLTKIHQVLEHYHGAETLANFLSGAINR